MNFNIQFYDMRLTIKCVLSLDYFTYKVVNCDHSKAWGFSLYKKATQLLTGGDLTYVEPSSALGSCPSSRRVLNKRSTYLCCSMVPLLMVCSRWSKTYYCVWLNVRITNDTLLLEEGHAPPKCTTLSRELARLATVWY